MEITQLPPSKLELAETMEQLRWIENANKIKVELTNIENVSVDTKEDLEQIYLF